MIVLAIMGRSTPIIATRWMGKNKQRERQDVMATGCDGYVPEPYSPRKLLARVYQYLT
jgi:CheY-like chemotaxis protein